MVITNQNGQELVVHLPLNITDSINKKINLYDHFLYKILYTICY